LSRSEAVKWVSYWVIILLGSALAAPSYGETYAGSHDVHESKDSVAQTRVEAVNGGRQAALLLKHIRVPAIGSHAVLIQ
jgi:hypothetical protein